MALLRYWIITRIQDYRLTALACLEDPCWEELSGDTIILSDREEAWNLARQYNGLLCSAEGMPSPRQSQRYAATLAERRAADAPPAAEEHADDEHEGATADTDAAKGGMAGRGNKRAGKPAGSVDQPY